MTQSDTKDGRTQSLRAFENLRDLILSGDLGAGTDHLETELALRLGMSRTPVREAVLMLEAQGLLEVRPRKGVRIISLSAIDMGEIYEVLTELESLAAWKAAKMGYTASALSELSDALTGMEKALQDEDREAWAEADDRFHAELVRLGGNARVRAIVGMMADQVRRARRLTLYMRPLPLKSNDDHRRVLEAIRIGDAETARRVHHDHREHAKTELTALLARHRLHQI
jgi:DNA-binding GntR family transcriptional regulator